MGEREKIAQIIAEHLCPQGKAHKTLYGAERMCYSRNNFADCEKVSECVDALLAANIGDVTAWREKVECAKRILQIPSLPDGKTNLAYFEYNGERIQDIARQRDEYKHCAEIAERALLTACVNLIKDEDNVDMELLAHVVYTKFLRKAEKELAEEKRE